MSAEVHDRSYWPILLVAFAGAAASAWFAATLFLQVFRGHGGPAGDILRVALGAAFVLVALFFFTVGVLYHRSFGPNRGQEFR